MEFYEVGLTSLFMRTEMQSVYMKNKKLLYILSKCLKISTAEKV